jgi:cytochrome c7-like protein
MFLLNYLAVLLAALFFATGSAATENWPIQQENKGEAQMVLSGGKTGNVPFPHHAHLGTLTDCKPCHELFPQENGAIEKLKEKGLLKKKLVMKTCQKCHRKAKKAGEKSGPTGCKDCHRIR